MDAHGTVRQAFAGKAHIVAVEKPGVEFLEQPGHGRVEEIRGSLEFQAESALPRWVEAVSAALRAARTLPQVNTKQTLIIGHSEGALVAALVASENSFVTHAASLAGPGPTMLFELTRKAREGRLYPDLQNNPRQQVAQLDADIAAVRRDPSSTTKQAAGHSHIYWSSRWPHSTMRIFSRSRARIFLAHGTADRNISFVNFELMSEMLREHKRDVTSMRVEGADHGFRIAGPPSRDAWGDVINNLKNWFLP